MRIKIDFDFNSELKVPYKYFEHLQMLVYDLLSEFPDISWLHDTGVKVEKRTYKPLCYSHLIGTRWTQKYNWVYKAPMTLYISSPSPTLIKAIETKLQKLAYYRFLGVTLLSTHYEITNTEEVTSCSFKTLSPIVCNMPIPLTDGRFYQQYISAFDTNFNRILKENLKNKAKIFYNLELKDDFELTPRFKTSDNHNHLYYYKNSAIKGWSGIFDFRGDMNYLYVANNCGIGAKNAQGFGLIELI